jgi:hypothetical protein
MTLGGSLGELVILSEAKDLDHADSQVAEIFETAKAGEAWLDGMAKRE